MKWGLGESYEKVIVSKKLRAYVDITKPASTVGVMTAYFLASLFYFYYIESSWLIHDRFTTLIVTVVTVGLAHAASQAMNMAEDADIDRETEHKQNRPIPSGVIEEEDARSISWLCSGLAVVLSFTINNTFGAVMMLLAFFGIFYNLDPIRAKERIISIPWQAVSRGLLSFPAVFAAYGNIFNSTAWILGFFMFFYVMGFQNSADIIDRHADAEHDIRTFVVEFGVDGTMQIATACTGAMYVIIGVAVGAGFLPYEYLWMMSLLPFCLIMLFYMSEYPYSVSQRTGNHPSWLWFYFGMVLCVVVPLLIEHLG